MYEEMLDGTADVFDRQELTARCLGNLDLVERCLAKFHARLDEELTGLERAGRPRI